MLNKKIIILIVTFIFSIIISLYHLLNKEEKFSDLPKVDAYQVNFGQCALTGSLYGCSSASVVELYNGLLETNITDCTLSGFPNYTSQGSSCSIVNTIYNLDDRLAGMRAGIFACIVEKIDSGELTGAALTETFKKLKGVGATKLANGINKLYKDNQLHSASEFLLVYSKYFTGSEYISIANDNELWYDSIGKLFSYLYQTYYSGVSYTGYIQYFNNANLNISKFGSGLNYLFTTGMIEQGSESLLASHSLYLQGYPNQFWNYVNTGTFNPDSIYKFLQYTSSSSRYASTDLNLPNPYTPVSALKVKLDFLSGVTGTKIASGITMNITGFMSVIPTINYSYNGIIRTGVEGWGNKFITNLDDDIAFKVLNQLSYSDYSTIYDRTGRFCVGGNIIDGTGVGSYSGDLGGRQACYLPVDYLGFDVTNTGYLDTVKKMYLRDDVFLYTYTQGAQYSTSIGPINNYNWYYKTALYRGLGWTGAANFVDKLVIGNMIDYNLVVGGMGYMDIDYLKANNKTILTGSDEPSVTELATFCQNLSGETLVKTFHTFEDINANATYGNFSDMLTRRQICINRSGKSDYIINRLVQIGDISAAASYLAPQSDSNLTSTFCNGSLTLANTKDVLEYYDTNNQTYTSSKILNLMVASCPNRAAQVADIASGAKLANIMNNTGITLTNSTTLLCNNNLSLNSEKILMQEYDNTSRKGAASNFLNSTIGSCPAKTVQLANIVNLSNMSHILDDANISVGNVASILNDSTNLGLQTGINLIELMSGLNYNRLYSVIIHSNLSNPRIANYISDNTFDQSLDVKLTKNLIDDNPGKIQNILTGQITQNLSKTLDKVKQIAIEDGLGNLVIEERTDIINSQSAYIQRLFNATGTYLNPVMGSTLLSNLTGNWNTGGISTGLLERNIVNAIDDDYMFKVIGSMPDLSGGSIMMAAGRYCVGGDFVNGTTSTNYSGDIGGRTPCYIPYEYYSFQTGDTSKISYINYMMSRKDIYLYTYNSTTYSNLVGPISNYTGIYNVNIIRGLAQSAKWYLDNAGGTVKNDFCSMIYTRKGSSIDLPNGIWVTQTEFDAWCPGFTASVNYFNGAGTSVDPYRLYAELSSATTVSAKSCQSYNTGATTLNNGSARGAGTCGNGSQACLSDGIYMIDPDGAGGNNAFNVYCDMSSNEGGWTLVMRSQNAQLPFTNSQYGDTLITNTTTNPSRFSDTMIKTLAMNNIFRVRNLDYGASVFFKLANLNDFSSTSKISSGLYSKKNYGGAWGSMYTSFDYGGNQIHVGLSNYTNSGLANDNTDVTYFGNNTGEDKFHFRRGSSMNASDYAETWVR